MCETFIVASKSHLFCRNEDCLLFCLFSSSHCFGRGEFPPNISAHLSSRSFFFVASLGVKGIASADLCRPGESWGLDTHTAGWTAIHACEQFTDLIIRYVRLRKSSNPACSVFMNCARNFAITACCFFFNTEGGRWLVIAKKTKCTTVRRSSRLTILNAFSEGWFTGESG
jgi:hypothetical protein